MSRAASSLRSLRESQQTDSLQERAGSRYDTLWLKAWRIILAHTIAALMTAMAFAPPRIQAVVAYGCSAVILIWIFCGDAFLRRAVGRATHARTTPQPPGGHGT